MSIVLFTCPGSLYDRIPGVETFSKKRDALTFAGSDPVVAHPPCRAWGKLRHMAKPETGEKEAAIFAVSVVRKNGGVLEHPESSLLWRVCDLPRPGKGKDQFGGWTLGISQDWFGHVAVKKTWLYIVGCDPRQLPPIPMAPPATRTVESQHSADRDKTPLQLAVWLLDLLTIIQSNRTTKS